MRNAYYLKKYNTYKVVSSETDINIYSSTGNRLITIGKNILPISSNSYFLKNKSEMFLFKSIILNNIERSLIIYFKKLTLKGIGFKCYKLTSNLLLLKIGYTHKIYYLIPYSDVSFLSKKGRILVHGSNVNNINNVVYEIKNLRQPDSYKGKGIIFSDEKLKLKSSKKRI